MNTNLQTATLAGGCFWCLEAVYDEIKGVHSVESGYTGGQMANPSYRAVCNGDTGHAEVVQVNFDPNIISYRDLLNVFLPSTIPPRSTARARTLVRNIARPSSITMMNRRRSPRN
jgi:methionine-S-sulfoxide reductase